MWYNYGCYIHNNTSTETRTPIKQNKSTETAMCDEYSGIMPDVNFGPLVSVFGRRLIADSTAPQTNEMRVLFQA